MQNKKPKTKNQNYCAGQAVIIVVVMLLLISLIIVSGFSTVVLKEAKIARASLISKKSYFLAEAGIEDAIYRIKTGKQILSDETITLDGEEVNTSISDVLGGSKDIISTGDFLNSIREIDINLSIATTEVDFFYGAQVGEGGVIMDENSRIEGAGGTPGNIFSNGPITGATGATITGDATVAMGISEDERSLTCSSPPDGDQIVGQSDPEIDFAQSFKPSDSEPLAKISIYIKKVGNPGDRDVFITVDDFGSPDDSYLAQGKLYSSLVGTNYNWTDVVFSSPPALTAGETYWIILDARRDANKYWVWCKDKNQGYGNGIAQYSEDWDDDPWTIIVGDLTFKTYLGTGISLIDDVDILGTARANTIQDSAISGDAYYQTITGSTIGGTSYPGSPDPPVANMPISQANIDQWKSDAGAGGTINGNCGDGGVAECIIGDDNTLSLGPKQINGNLILTKKQTLNVTGTLYFTGYINIDSSGGATIKCDSSYGADSCIIITDSWIHIKNNASFQGSGQSGSYMMVLTDLSGCIGGSQQPECTDHNGAIDFHNNATGAIFYSAGSLVNLHNGVSLTEIVAYKLKLDNTAAITYEQGLINSSFSSGPSGGWAINKWQEGQ